MRDEGLATKNVNAKRTAPAGWPCRRRAQAAQRGSDSLARQQQLGQCALELSRRAAAHLRRGLSRCHCALALGDLAPYALAHHLRCASRRRTVTSC